MKIMICIGVAIAILLMQFGMAQNSYGEEIENENYKISRNIIKNIVKRGSITEDVISIENKGETQKTVRLSSNGGIISIIESLDLDKKTVLSSIFFISIISFNLLLITSTLGFLI